MIRNGYCMMILSVLSICFYRRILDTTAVSTYVIRHIFMYNFILDANTAKQQTQHTSGGPNKVFGVESRYI